MEARLVGVPVSTIVRPAVHRVGRWQLVAVLVVAVSLSLVGWPVWAAGAACGAAIEMLGRAYFAFYAFRYAGARQMARVANAFRRGALGKFILVMSLFGLLFWLWRDVNPVAVLTGYLAAWLHGTLLTQRLLK